METKKLFDKLRAGPWLAFALILATIVGLLYPHQLGVLLWALTKLSFGAYLGYWIDRSVFFYARPNDIKTDLPHHSLLFSVCMLRRAGIMAAAIISLGLGV